jgi:hypothetical protein
MPRAGCTRLPNRRAGDGPQQIARQARDALTSAMDAGVALPPAVEDWG